jgi:protein-export membrane protein SecD
MRSKSLALILAVIIITVAAGVFIYPPAWNNTLVKAGLPEISDKPFRMGLDLLGGTQLVYEADLSNISDSEKDDSMSGLRDVIERRINLFGVTEPVVQVNKVGNSRRLVVELAGIKDIKEAIKLIGETPFLEFREEPLADQLSGSIDAEGVLTLQPHEKDEFGFVATELNGRYLKRATLEFDQQTSFKPQVALQFNDEGAELFRDITQRNVGKVIAIYLDGAPISSPVVRETISGGQAVITGDFSIEEARQLVERLNAGALPVPINLISQQSVGATLGEESLKDSLLAGIIALVAVALFMILWYRLPGLFAVLTLGIYIILVLAIFKLIPVTLTLAGIAGVIMSLGMAVDANVLIFERMKEEAQFGKNYGPVVEEGFARAWTSIRDSNLTTIITSVILFYFGTGGVKGFALTLMIGILMSLFTAIVVTRSFLRLLVGSKVEKWRFGLKLPKSNS